MNVRRPRSFRMLSDNIIITAKIVCEAQDGFRPESGVGEFSLQGLANGGVR